MGISDWSSDVCSSDLLAERFFVRSETGGLLALPAEAREAAFVRLWCAKEAVHKAHGRGLAFGLDRLEFALRGDDWALVACDPALGRPSDWTLHAFHPLPGSLASLAWRQVPQDRKSGGEGRGGTVAV